MALNQEDIGNLKHLSGHTLFLGELLVKAFLAIFAIETYIISHEHDECLITGTLTI